MIVLLVALVCWNPTIDSLVVPIKPQLPKGQLSKQTKSLRDARSLLSFRHQVVAPRSDEDQMDGIPRRPSYFSLPEILTPPKIDTQAVLWITGSQGVVFLTAVFCQILFFGKSIDQTTMLSFDRDSIVLALQISVITVIAGVVFDKLPNERVQRIVRDTRVYTLRIIGRNTSNFNAFLASTLLALSAGVSEELLFRGFLLVALKQYFGTNLAIFISSATFGLAHYPVFGASALVEATLGGIFAFSYVYSGYNLAVPIAIHTLYDLFTIYYTWVGASKDIKSKGLPQYHHCHNTTFAITALIHWYIYWCWCELLTPHLVRIPPF